VDGEVLGAAAVQINARDDVLDFPHRRDRIRRIVRNQLKNKTVTLNGARLEHAARVTVAVNPQLDVSVLILPHSLVQRKIDKARRENNVRTIRKTRATKRV
jgi:hypothetical protein